MNGVCTVQCMSLQIYKSSPEEDSVECAIFQIFFVYYHYYTLTLRVCTRASNVSNGWLSRENLRNEKYGCMSQA